MRWGPGGNSGGDDGGNGNGPARVSTEHSGIPELVVDGQSGFLVPERDVEALANRLDGLLRSPERWPAMGAAGRRQTEAAFEVNHLNDTLVEIFRHIITGAKS